ncbi:MAG: acyl carrier protein [Chthoniobacterales bacterium]|jgi:acyl carrier protein
MPTELTQAQIDDITRNYKRCREGTVDAIVNLRRTGDTSNIPTIMRGIVWRYVRPEIRSQAETAPPETPLTNLGMDSLMMLEVVLDLQDALDITIEDSELRNMKTIGDVTELLTQKYVEKHKAAA